jgi:hypothetical protein
MRSLIDGGYKRRRPAARDRSRFRRTGGEGGRDLIRFRRNREALWREISTCVLWIGLTVMLVNLAGTLNRVAGVHLADRNVVVRAVLPLMALGAAGFCLLRARRNVFEIVDIRREQREITDRLRVMASDDGEPPSTILPRD